MPSSRRKPFHIGASRGVTLPSGMRVSDEVSIAASDRLLLIDTTGEVSADKLLQFFSQHVEPAFQRWLESQRFVEASGHQGGIRPLEAGRDVTPREVNLEPTSGVFPGAPVQDITCAACGGYFRWDLSRGNQGYCPYCGQYLIYRSR
jgi:hypothetical protein